MSKSTKRKHPSKKDFEQIDKNEHSVNKQLTEIYHNKHKIYLQSKNKQCRASRCTSVAKSNCSSNWSLNAVGFKRRVVVE